MAPFSSCMRPNPIRQPLNRGVTLVELMIGVAVIGVLSLVIAGMLKAGMTTYNYTMKKLVILRHTRQALDSSGASHGMVWAIRGAQGVWALESDALSLQSANGSRSRLSVVENKLTSSQFDVATTQSDGISSVRFKYYNLDDSGRLVESSVPQSVALVVSTIKMPDGRTEHVTFSGAALRNR
jgi:prepilin-type N-terminal cleavage/methylation domain-containing protein